eukprot:2845940-Rhodomonas_salina.1
MHLLKVYYIVVLCLSLLIESCFARGLCKCNCRSLLIAAETGKSGSYLWSSRHGFVYYATICDPGDECECKTCPLSLLPSKGSYSPLFYGDDMMDGNEIRLPLASVLAMVPASEGISSCQEWVVCADEYVFRNGTCEDCSTMQCGPGWTCDRQSVACVPCEFQTTFLNSEEAVWSGVECAVECQSGFYLTATGCNDCLSGFYCPRGSGSPIQCPGGTRSLPWARSVDDCVTVSTTLPVTYSGVRESYLTWETTGCGTFVFEAETVLSTLGVFPAGVNASGYPRSALSLCSGEFRPTVNPEYLHHLPCICRSEFDRIDSSGIVVDRVVPKTLGCPKGSYLVSPGRPITGQRIEDNICMACPQRTGLCTAGYYSPLCSGGFNYLRLEFFDVTLDTVYSIPRYTLRLSSRPTQCEMKCNTQILGQFEYFSDERGIGDCTRGVCSSCAVEQA